MIDLTLLFHAVVTDGQIVKVAMEYQINMACAVAEHSTKYVMACHQTYFEALKMVTKQKMQVFLATRLLDEFCKKLS